MHIARSIVIGIKKVSVLWNFCPVSPDEFFQDKSFEKPRGMREMPFGRADVRHGLHDAILGFETNTKRIGELSDLMEAIPQSLDPRLAPGKKRSIRCCGGGF